MLAQAIPRVQSRRLLFLVSVDVFVPGGHSSGTNQNEAKWPRGLGGLPIKLIQL